MFNRHVTYAILAALFFAVVACSFLNTATQTGDPTALFVAAAFAITAVNELGVGLYLSASALPKKWDVRHASAYCVKHIVRDLSFAALAVYFGTKARTPGEWALAVGLGVVILLDIGLWGVILLHFWHTRAGDKA